jgi:hypothetical protein
MYCIGKFNEASTAWSDFYYFDFTDNHWEIIDVDTVVSSSL